MTKVNKNLENPTPQMKKGAEGLSVKPQKAIQVVDAGHAPYQVDLTPVLLEEPSSPFAIALSISIIIGALVALIKTLKSN
ncbi:MAG: hypothetical protein V7K26_13645 [Nostoc sp.]|uniref:hypothetical protein n=1 Tax=Nostoc sp. TaxID=1180 RepID=UPI002FEF9E2A